MERLLTWIRDNPQFAAITFVVTVLALVMTVLALTMARSGASLRRLIWSKAYTFNLQALKSPVIDVVTQAGWRWQPVTWNAPASLRWLTE